MNYFSDFWTFLKLFLLFFPIESVDIDAYELFLGEKVPIVRASRCLSQSVKRPMFISVPKLGIRAFFIFIPLFSGLTAPPVLF